MSWKTMPKQKRDLMVLGIILGVGALILVYMYVLTPWLNARADRIREQATLQEDIRKAKALRTKLGSLQTRKLRDELRNLGSDLEHLLPPDENSFLWANGWLDRAVRKAGLTLSTVNELSLPPMDWVQSPAKGAKDPSSTTNQTGIARQKKRFGPYRISCTIMGDFRDMQSMIEMLQSENPYISIVELDVVGDASDKLNQRAELTIEWPRHSGPYDKKLAEFLLEKKTGGTQP